MNYIIKVPIDYIWNHTFEIELARTIFLIFLEIFVKDFRLLLTNNCFDRFLD